MMLMRVGSLIAVSMLLPSIALSQADDLAEALENPYVQSGLQVVDRIVSGELTFDPADVAGELFRRLEVARGSGEDIETQVLSEVLNQEELEELINRLPRSDALPPVTPGVRLLIAGSILDNAEQLQENGVVPEVDDMADAIGLSLYLTLASATLETGEQERIDVTAVRRGGIWFFSLGWPVCCSHEMR